MPRFLLGPQARLRLGDQRVNERVEPSRGCGVGEGERGESRPIDALVRAEDGGAVGVDERAVAGLPRPVEIGDDGVGIGGDAAEGAEQTGDGRLPAGDPAGQADVEDQARLRNAAESVFCISMAMVIGPTPPGTGVR